MNSEVFLSAHGVRKTYVMGARQVEVLKGVDLKICTGEFTALQGASGAGKSTLLHLMGGLDAPNEGDIFFKGINLARLSENQRSDIRNKEVGFIFQSYHLFPELDAMENVMLPGRIGRKSKSELTDRARSLLTRVGLGERLSHRPKQLSGGEQQRVAIARALINEPVLILADEPTGNLDSRTGEGIIQLLEELRTERNATLLIATHDAKVANRAPRVVRLVDGLLANSSESLDAL